MQIKLSTKLNTFEISFGSEKKVSINKELKT